MSEHTPGPWIYDKENYEIIAPSVVPDWWEPIEGEDYTPRTVIVYLRGSMGGHDTTADARLIASAPALLDLVRRLTHPMATEEDVDDALALLKELDA